MYLSNGKSMTAGTGAFWQGTAWTIAGSVPSDKKIEEGNPMRTFSMTVFRLVYGLHAALRT